MDATSEQRLVGVNPDLVRVVRRAHGMVAPDLTFRVTEGLRTKERQRKLLLSGASTTMKSRHLTGHAVDLVALVDLDGDGRFEVRWDWPLYHRLAGWMKTAAREEGVPIEWGGDWKTFKDGPHFQLPWSVYP